MLTIDNLFDRRGDQRVCEVCNEPIQKDSDLSTCDACEEGLSDD